MAQRRVFSGRDIADCTSRCWRMISLSGTSGSGAKPAVDAALALDRKRPPAVNHATAAAEPPRSELRNPRLEAALGIRSRNLLIFTGTLLASRYQRGGNGQTLRHAQGIANSGPALCAAPRTQPGAAFSARGGAHFRGIQSEPARRDGSNASPLRSATATHPGAFGRYLAVTTLRPRDRSHGAKASGRADRQSPLRGSRPFADSHPSAKRWAIFNCAYGADWSLDI